MTILKNNIFKSSVKVLLVFTSILSISVFLMRVFFSLDNTVLTSGCEEESLYAIWKYVHSFDIYLPNNKFPYTSSYFNINFYLFYGEICELCIHYLSLNDSYIPIITRLTSVIFTLGIFIITYKLFRRRTSQVNSLLIASIFVFNPYIGFWSLTCRPDIAATFFSILALYQFKSDNKINFKVILFLAVAWSFKQSFIFTAFFIFFHDGVKNVKISRAIIFAILIALIITTSYYLYGNNYFYSVFLGQENQGLDLILGIHNLSLFVFKGGPIILLFVILKSWKNKSLLLLLIFALTSIITSKDGASDNYFFEFYVIMISIISIKIKENLEFLEFYLIPQIFVLLILMSGIKGKLIPDKFIQNDLLVSLQENKEMSVVLNQSAANLPWIIHGPIENIYHVKSFTYDIDILKHPFEFGGIFGSLNKSIYTKIYVHKSDKAELIKIPKDYIMTKEISHYYILKKPYQ